MKLKSLPYDCINTAVVYSSAGKGITSGWMVTNEWNFSCLTLVPPCKVFNYLDQRENFSSPDPMRLDFSSSADFQKFENPALGSTIYASPTQFITM